MSRLAICIAIGLLFADPEVTQLRTKVDRLEKEAEESRGLDSRLLYHMDRALNEKPDDPLLRSDTILLAKRLATHSLGSRLVWQVLLNRKVLTDGMTVKQAEELLGPATDKGQDSVSWYFNPHNRHVAPCLQAKATEKGLVGWKIFSR